MAETDEPLASGRDADVFAVGDDLVLRRSRRGQSMAAEAALMSHLADHGYPVPRVESVSDDGTELTMERLHGPVMADALLRRPWRAGYYGRILGTLLERLHLVPPPTDLRSAAVGTGSRIVHLDLHPVNVMLTERGPVVIDWTNAGRGSPSSDVALSWLLIQAGTVDVGPILRRVVDKVRAGLIHGLLSVHDRPAVAAHLAAVAEWKAADRNMNDDEIATMRALVAAETG